MSGTDSSDEDNADLLREAADNQFLNDSMFKGKEKKVSEKTVPSSVPKLPSLRPDRKKDDPNVLGVTPDFQKHVAKHLMKIIDSQIHEVTATDEGLAATRKAQEDGGVRLLRASRVLLSVEEEPPKKQKRLKPVKRVDDDRSEKERLSEAAVSADWILSKEAIKGWVKNTKGEVISVKNSEVQETRLKCWENNRGAGEEEEAVRKKKKRKDGKEATAIASC
ncbi:protein CUSTOS [Anabrus simplex]|uniref:protein CUSTOS n=1 Tax=Anabrus simplex TaxID=316456 RepID=UPI0035A3D4E2